MALVNAVGNGQEIVVRLLLDSINEDGFTALMEAAAANHHRIFRLLLQHQAGLDLNRTLFGLYKSKKKDYLVINISSQKSSDALKSLIKEVLSTRQDLNLSQPSALVIKISSDLTEADMMNIAEVITSPGHRVDGIIVGHETLADVSTISTMSRLTGGEVPIIGAGGVTTGQEAVMMIRAGASLVQVTTGLMVRGPATATNIRREMAEALVTQGAETVTQCVGAELR